MSNDSPTFSKLKTEQKQNKCSKSDFTTECFRIIYVHCSVWFFSFSMVEIIVGMAGDSRPGVSYLKFVGIVIGLLGAAVKIKKGL
jgi:hypothetical protein